MIVVSNTTPIISLACVQRLNLLERLFGRIVIAEAVYREIKAKRGWYSSAVCRAVLQQAGEE